MLEALLFDLDGTLVDTDPAHLRVWQEVLAPYGIAIDEEIYRTRFSGRLNPEILREFLPEMAPDRIQILADAKEARFREVGVDLQPIAGCLGLLDWCDALQLKRALVSNAPRQNAEFMLKVLGLSDRFPLVVLGEELPRAKPDPLPYRIALKSLGVCAAAALAFEDSPSGMRSAVAAGIRTVAVASTQPRAVLAELGATLIVDNYTETKLWDLLRGD